MFQGIMLSLATGFVWVFIGVIFSYIAKNKINVINMSIISSVMSAIGLLIFITDCRGIADSGVFPPVIYTLLIIFAGAMNMSGMLLVQSAMKYGHNSVTWAICQSALIVPFFCGLLLLGEKSETVKIAGALLVVGGILTLSRIRGGSERGTHQAGNGKWLAMTLFSFLTVGIAQALQAASPYFSYQDKFETRPILVTAGSLLAVIGGRLILRDTKFEVSKKMFTLALLMTAVNITGLKLLFMAIDSLASVNMVAAVYPIAVGTCITGFTVYSMTVLREKINALILAGTALIVTGIICFCLTK